MISWVYLAFAIIFEVVGTISLKYSSLTNNHLYSALTAICYVVSFVLLWFTIKKLDIGMAYAIWAGIGTAVISVLGFLIFKEQITLIKVLFICLIIVGVVGLKYTSAQ
ncbi:DMT family transporter [Poseidonibacter sp.]|uniref:DMT family transporter n=1 Tax=Poseidonibacter sp. TaxID=2321188 RepID=UPI00359E25B1